VSRVDHHERIVEATKGRANSQKNVDMDICPTHAYQRYRWHEGQNQNLAGKSTGSVSSRPRQEKRVAGREVTMYHRSWQASINIIYATANTEAVHR
jgi:hypothetical protein